MTATEAIDLLDNLIGMLEDNHGSDYDKALKMAIEALKQKPCEDCVSRNAIIKTLNEMDRYISDELTLCDNNNKFPQNEVFIVDDVYEEIVEQLPPVTPNQKTGHWIGHRQHCENLGVMPSGLGAYKWCSNCDCGIDIKEWHRTDYNYCPNCGAKMESEE